MTLPHVTRSFSPWKRSVRDYQMEELNEPDLPLHYYNPFTSTYPSRYSHCTCLYMETYHQNLLKSIINNWFPCKQNYWSVPIPVKGFCYTDLSFVLVLRSTGKRHMASYLQFLLVPQKGVANQRPESVLANWTIVPSAQHGKNRLEETDMNTE